MDQSKNLRPSGSDLEQGLRILCLCFLDSGDGKFEGSFSFVIIGSAAVVTQSNVKAK